MSSLASFNNTVEYYINQYFITQTNKEQDVKYFSTQNNQEKDSKQFLKNLGTLILRVKKEVRLFNVAREKLNVKVASLSNDVTKKTTKLEFQTNESQLKSKQNELEALVTIELYSRQHIEANKLKIIKLPLIKEVCILRYSISKEDISNQTNNNQVKKMDAKQAFGVLVNDQESNGSWEMDYLLLHLVRTICPSFKLSDDYMVILMNVQKINSLYMGTLLAITTLKLHCKENIIGDFKNMEKKANDFIASQHEQGVKGDDEKIIASFQAFGLEISTTTDDNNKEINNNNNNNNKN